MYIINKRTKVIKHVQKGMYRTKILEANKVKYSTYSLLKILDHNCTINGASFNGRIETVMEILGSKSKLPVPVLPIFGVFMFPTSSIKNNDCMLLSYYQIEKYVPYGKHAAIQFKDKSNILVKTSVNQFDLQMKRTSQVIAYFLGFFFRPQ